MAAHNRPDSGLMAPSNGVETHDYMEIGGVAHRIHKIIVHRFTVGDADDPELYAAQPLYEWQQSDQGKWVMSHSVDTPVWHRQLDQFSYGYQYAITAKLKGVDYTFYQLKWGQNT